MALRELLLFENHNTSVHSLFSRSTVCKMSAVAFDWNRTFGFGFGDDYAGEVNEEHARWIEVDEKGDVVPPWRAFRLF